MNFRVLTLLTLLLSASCVLLHPGSLLSAPQEASSSSTRFCKALPGYQFEFPRDHFSHPCFRTEWWYFTGNLTDPNGRRFGFELTFFREGIENPYDNPSRWRVDDLYLAHFAVSDLAAERFSYADRLHRAGIEMAGVDAASGRIWNGNWSATLRGESWLLDAAEGGQRIRLELDPLRPPVIQGRNGVSQKPPAKATLPITIRSRGWRLPASWKPGALPTRSPDFRGWTMSSRPTSCSPSRSAGTGSACK